MKRIPVGPESGSVSGGQSLRRSLGTLDATMIGIGSMVGAGIFVVFAPAADIAGNGLFLGLLIAAIIAVSNALSSAQLAAQYPTSGGSYIFARERLGEWLGFFAGWSFVIGKTASCVAMALAFASYAVPEPYVKPLAVLGVIGLTTVNYFGVTRTARVTKVIVSLVLMILAVIVLSSVLAEPVEPHPFAMFEGDLLGDGWYQILQSAGLLFFAFAGYARIATLGEEVKSPSRTIPRAIVTALSCVLVVYVLVGFVALQRLGVDALAVSTEPLADVVAAADWAWAIPMVRIGAALASLGALLALVAGIGRTVLAMARNADLPPWLGGVHPRYQVPHRAEVLLAVMVIALILLVDVREAIGFSSFGVLLYYFFTNLAALTQDKQHRRYPKIIQIVGAFGCIVLVVALPWPAIAIGIGILGLGFLYRLLYQRLTRGARQQ